MKTTSRILAWLLVATCLICTNALAFYDPGVQRWINRDPIQEKGGVNLHSMHGGDPVSGVDFMGLFSGKVHVRNNCDGVDLSGYTYLAESEPPSEADKKSGRKEGRKPLRQLPKPGQSVDADAIYYPGGAMKIGDLSSVDVDCSGETPRLIHGPIVKTPGDGAKWNAGEPNPPVQNWPDADAPTPPYLTTPPVKPLPPKNPTTPIDYIPTH